jgi:hypothetical protein
MDRRAASIAMAAAASLLLVVGGVAAGLDASGAFSRGTAQAHSSLIAGTRPVSPTRPPASASPPTPSPVAMAASLAGNCTTGVEDQATGVFYPARTVGRPGNLIPSGDTVVGAYQVTLTNHSTATAEITGFAVVFHDYSGTETGSDSQHGFDRFIPTGQSLTWTEAPWGSVVNAPFAAGQTGAIDSESTCRLVRWTHP